MALGWIGTWNNSRGFVASVAVVLFLAVCVSCGHCSYIWYVPFLKKKTKYGMFLMDARVFELE
jgi:hypothetical protein